MEHITSILNNPAFTALVNTQIFTAILLALTVYRLISPVIDLLNPFFMLIGIVNTVKNALLRNSHTTGAACHPSGSGGAMQSSN